MGKIIGYYQSWNRYQQCKVSEINPSLYNYLVYAFVGIQNNKLRVNDNYGDVEAGGFTEFTKLAEQHGVLPMLAVGGYAEGVASFSSMACSKTSRKKFIDSCLTFCEEYGFNGIDLDWEYPSSEGTSNNDKKNFSSLIKEMHRKFEDEGYVLSAAVAAGEYVMKKSYDVEVLNEYLDFINLMVYDMHSPNDNSKCTGHNAPLHSGDEFNLTTAVNNWINEGVDVDSLILGIPAYGRGYKLANPRQTHIGAPSAGVGEKESVGYNELVNYTGWTRQWDSFQQVPYMYKGNQWICYDDEKSVEIKAEFAIDNKLGGVMIYSIDTDCPRGSNPFPLTKAAKKYI